jgi:hypothetical protein
MKWEYEKVDTSTEKGLKRAEALHKAGHRMIVIGFNKLMFEKKIKELKQ